MRVTAAPWRLIPLRRTVAKIANRSNLNATSHLVRINKALLPLSNPHSRAMSSSSNSMECRELEIPLPLGKLAGKEWGPADGRPWICLHGWLDNCGTFDTLAPLFPEGHRLICLDSPGHGYSFHNPPGFPYHFADALQIIKRVAQHLGLERFSLLGHSMGGGMALIFAATYPELVEKLIMLDVVGPMPRMTEELIKRTRQHVEMFVGLENKIENNPTPAYPYEEARQRLLDASTKLHGTQVITEASADILLRRGTRPSEAHPGKVEYTRDVRHTVPGLYGYPVGSIIAFAQAISCPHLVVTADCSSYSDMRKRGAAIYDIYKSANGDNFMHDKVEGTHHVHLNNPERIVGIIRDFIEKTDHKEEI